MGQNIFLQKYFKDYLVFITDKKYIKYFSSTTRIDSWKSSGTSKGNIEHITKSDSNFAPTLADHHLLLEIISNWHCLVNNTSILKIVINLYISDTLNPCFS